MYPNTDNTQPGVSGPTPTSGTAYGASPVPAQPAPSWPSPQAQPAPLPAQPAQPFALPAAPAPTPIVPPVAAPQPYPPMPPQNPVAATTMPAYPYQQPSAPVASQPQQTPYVTTSPVQPQAWQAAPQVAAAPPMAPGQTYGAPAYQTTPPRPAPAFMPPAPQPTVVAHTEQSLARLRKRVRNVIIVTVTCMIVGTLVAVGLMAVGKNYSQTDLVTYTGNGVSFEYPKQWKELDPLPYSAKAGFGDDADALKASSAIVLSSNDPGLGSLSSIGPEQVRQFQSLMKDRLMSASLQDTLKLDADCDTTNSMVASPTPDTYPLKGDQFDFKCSRLNGQKIEMKGYIGLAPDGTLYTIQLAAVDNAYADNQATYDEMLNSLKVGL